MASNNSTASTVLDPFGRNKVQIGFEVFFAVVICLVSILGNFLVVFVVNKDSQLKNITNMFIHNLAWTDICMAALVMPVWITSLYNGRWIFSTELCEWTATIAVTTGSASLWTMAAIAVNRYLKVVKTNIYPKFFPSIRMARGYCVLVWLIGVLTATPPLYGWGRYAYHRRSAVCNLVWEVESISNAIFFSGVFGGIFSVILFCYYKIYRKVKVSSTNLASHAAQNNSPNISQNSASQTTDIKLLKTTFTVVCVFAVCYTPASVITLCEAIFGPPPRLATTMMMYLIFCSSSVNPFIYGLMNPQLKGAFKKVLRCKTSEQERQANQGVGSQEARGTACTQHPIALQPMA